MQLSEKHLEAMKSGRANRLNIADSDSSNANLTILQKQTLKRVSEYLPTAFKTFLKAFQGGKAAAIKAKCVECCNMQKIEVTRCGIEGCPLWMVRPYQDKKTMHGDK